MMNINCIVMTFMVDNLSGLTIQLYILMTPTNYNSMLQMNTPYTIYYGSFAMVLYFATVLFSMQNKLRMYLLSTYEIT